MSKQFQMAVEAIKKGDKEFGRQLLLGIIKNDRNNIDALLWLTRTGLGMQESAKIFGRVLLIDPENKPALEGLERIRVLQERGYLVTPSKEVAKPTTLPKKSLLKSPAKVAPAAPSSPPVVAPVEGGYVLEILALTDKFSDADYFRVAGQVKNISDQKLTSVIAVVQFHNKQGKMLHAEEIPLEADPLLPNQTATFRVAIKDHPAINHYAVVFKRLFGSNIPTVDNR